MLGASLYSAHLGEVALSKTAYEPAMFMGAHVPRHLHRGMLIFHPAGEMHADCALDESMATINVEYITGELPREFICAHGPALDELRHSLLSALPAGGRVLERPLGAVREFLWSKAPRAADGRIAGARQAFESAQAQAPVASLASRLGMHRGRLHRAFKRAYGESPRNDLTKQRAASAVDLLLETALSIAEVAAECGYFDQSHFCRQFKHLSGMSPSRFRATFAR